MFNKRVHLLVKRILILTHTNSLKTFPLFKVQSKIKQDKSLAKFLSNVLASINTLT